jgi:acyl carrier protein
VSAQVAAVLGLASPDAVDAERKFKEVGFDSLSAVELRNRLSQVSGRRLPSTLIFDHPSPAAVARYLAETLAPRDGDGDGDNGGNGTPREAEIRRIIASISLDKLRSAGLLDPLVKLAEGDGNGDGDGHGDGNGDGNGDGEAKPRGDVDELDLDELVRMARRTT